MTDKAHLPSGIAAKIDTKKSEIATELLDWAIKAFFSGSGYFAAINLAGAAEENLSVYLNERRVKSAYERFEDLYVAVSEIENSEEEKLTRKNIFYRMHNPKNSVKYMYDLADETVSFNAEEVAIEVIKRAITNYHLLAKVRQIRDIPSVMEFKIWEWERYKKNTVESDDLL